jgi:pyruvate/2-oxoglutarate dehydrogenase complex dihydrolipoamide acyltransferase (E2) component
MRVIVAGEYAPDVSKANVTHWFVQEGAVCEAGSDLVEFADSKNVFVVKAPARMRVVRIVAQKGALIDAASVLCEGDDA